jgi:hypothetical protein
MTPTEIQLVAPAFIDAYRRAEQEGYHAVVPLGMLDLGVDGGRCTIDIPVIAPMEACLPHGGAARRTRPQTEPPVLAKIGLRQTARR